MRHFVVPGAIALFCAGCSDPVPPAAEGGTTVTWQGSSSQCAVKKVHNGQIGNVSGSEIVELKKDTVAGAVVYCKVSGSGGTYNAEGRLRLRDVTIEFDIRNASPNADPTNPALGSIGYSDIETAGAVYSSPAGTPCRFWFNPNTQTPQIAPGRFWVQFGCAELVDASKAPPSTCGVQDESTIAVQNCDQ